MSSSKTKTSPFSRLPRTGVAASTQETNAHSSQASQAMEQASSTRRLLGALTVPLEMLSPNPRQVRRTFDEASLSELAEDIRVRGVLEPLLVRTNAEGNYEIVAGERRFRAARLAALKEVPVILKEMDEREARYVMLVENIQRQDLDPLDEQAFFQQLQNEYNLSLTEIARQVNKSKSYVDRRLRGELVGMKEVEVRDDSEKSNIVPEAGNLLSSSQPDGSEAVVTRPTVERAIPRYNRGSFARFSQVLDSTIEILQNSPDPKTVDRIRQNVIDMEQKLARLKQELEQIER